MHAREHFAWNPGDPAVGLALYARSARRILREHDRDARRREVGQAHSTGEGREQGVWTTRPAECLEGRGLAKGNPGEQTRFWTQGQMGLQHALNWIRTSTVRYYSRQEPGAVVPHAGICAGGAG